MLGATRDVVSMLGPSPHVSLGNARPESRAFKVKNNTMKRCGKPPKYLQKSPPTVVGGLPLIGHVFSK